MSDAPPGQVVRQQQQPAFLSLLYSEWACRTGTVQQQGCSGSSRWSELGSRVAGDVAHVHSTGDGACFLQGVRCWSRCWVCMVWHLSFTQLDKLSCVASFHPTSSTVMFMVWRLELCVQYCHPVVCHLAPFHMSNRLSRMAAQQPAPH
jgi:hypothetical protein